MQRVREPKRSEAGLGAAKNYLTPSGYEALSSELQRLVSIERPQLVETIAWAASNGDRSENGDYIYGKKRLREMDRRIRYLTKALAEAVVIDPAKQDPHCEQVFFGATVTLWDCSAEQEETWQIVGVDEADPQNAKISWRSPLAQALLRRRLGDEVEVLTPSGVRRFEIIEVRYR